MMRKRRAHAGVADAAALGAGLEPGNGGGGQRLGHFGLGCILGAQVGRVLECSAMYANIGAHFGEIQRLKRRTAEENVRERSGMLGSDDE